MEWPMAPAAYRKRLFGVAAVAIAVPLGFALALGTATLSRPDAPLQRLADEAALAGVNALAASQGQPDHSRVSASIEAASKVVSGQPAIIRSITPSGDAMTVAVVLADPDNRAVSSAAARYIAPSDGFAAQTSAELSPTAASRERM
jgi:hypothetical protein